MYHTSQEISSNRVRTTYYTRKSLTAVPIGNILHPENNVSDYTVTVDGYNDNIVYPKYNPTAANGGSWKEKFVHNPEGMMRHYSYEEHYPFYFIKDHLGNIRETYINPAPNTKYLIQRMQYYPSGIPWKTSTGATEHPYRYSGKELVQMHGQDEYDSHARWYYPAICRTTTMDPLCEKYYNISPYAWCANNFVNVVDINGDTIKFEGTPNDIESLKSEYSAICNIFPLFAFLYNYMDSSPFTYTIRFGETTTNKAENVAGQYYKSIITYDKSSAWQASIYEETFHAFQDDNRRRGVWEGKLNREFEAKFFVSSVLSAAMVPTESKYARDFINKWTVSIPENYNIYRSNNFLKEYERADRKFSEYYRNNRIGNNNYWVVSNIGPVNILYLLNLYLND